MSDPRTRTRRRTPTPAPALTAPAPARPPHSPPRSVNAWRDVRIETEQVRRVVALLHHLEPLVGLVAERSPHTLNAFLADKIEPGAAGRVRRAGALELAQPGEIARVVGGVLPHREQVRVPRRLSLSDRGRALRNPRDLAAAGNDQDLGKGRRRVRVGGAVHVDRLVGQLDEEVPAPVVAKA